MYLLRLTLSLGLFLVAITPVFGETVYVSDRLIVSLRAGQSERSQAIITIKSDTPLEVLNKENDYFLVRAPTGERGWVLSQYVTKDTPKALVIDQLNRKVAELEKMIDNLRSKENDLEQRTEAAESQNETLSRQLTETEEKRRFLQQENTKLNQEYANLRQSAADVVKIVAERDRLAGEKENLSAQLENSETEKADLLRTAAIKWFAAGAGVLAVGWILGRISRKKRNLY
ncbi:MAG: TIGR04211 family SH3 domain-containing protein [Desulfuromonadaceae bacterium]|nr:TIGR04211 family SH3 domain-containing protein [Desulfuromonadaceae bacterium]